MDVVAQDALTVLSDPLNKGVFFYVLTLYGSHAKILSEH